MVEWPFNTGSLDNILYIQMGIWVGEVKGALKEPQLVQYNLDYFKEGVNCNLNLNAVNSFNISSQFYDRMQFPGLILHGMKQKCYNDKNNINSTDMKKVCHRFSSSEFKLVTTEECAWPNLISISGWQTQPFLNSVIPQLLDLMNLSVVY